MTHPNTDAPTLDSLKVWNQQHVESQMPSQKHSSIQHQTQAITIAHQTTPSIITADANSP